MVQKFGGTSVGKFPDKVSAIDPPAIHSMNYLSLFLLCEELSADGAALGQIARDIVRLVDSVGINPQPISKKRGANESL